MDLVTLTGITQNTNSSSSLAQASAAARLQRAQKVMAALNASAVGTTQATDTFSLTRSADPLAVMLTAALQDIGTASTTLSPLDRALGTIQSALTQMQQLTQQAQASGISAANRQADVAKLNRLRDQINQVVKQNPVLKTGTTITTTDITGAATTYNLSAALPAAANTAAKGGTVLDAALGQLDAGNAATFKTAGSSISDILSRVQSAIAEIRTLKSQLASDRSAAIAQYAGNVAIGNNQALDAITAQSQLSSAQSTILQQAALALMAHGNVGYLSVMSLYLTS